MNLESAIKYFSPKSPNLSDASAATGERMAITDVMAALGLAEAQAQLGFELFLSKMEITSCDRAVEMLAEFGIRQTSKYRAMRELSDDTQRKMVEVLAAFASSTIRAARPANGAAHAAVAVDLSMPRCSV